MTSKILPQRKPLRLSGYDYSRPGYYYITMCSYGRICLFGDVARGKMNLNPAGMMLNDIWHDLPLFYQSLEIDTFVVMPNHIHGILKIKEPKRSTSISSIIKSYKTFTMKKYIEGVHQKGWQPFCQKLWQRSFHDHIIRNDLGLSKIREYILNNPANWEQDNDYR